MITEESFVDFKCPYCRETVSFPQPDAGHARACPMCNETVIVPDDGSEVGREPPLPINTERLVLRRFAPGDWKDLLELMSDEELFTYSEGRPLNEDEVLHWLEAERNVKLTTPEQLFYLGIELKDGGKVIGFVALRFEDPWQARLHVMLNRSYQHKGYSVEAMDALLGFCFRGIKLHRVSVRFDSRNSAAQKLCENLGLRKEGEFLKDTRGVEEWHTSLHYAALEEEYFKASAA
jgi:[ribosomal protein S5]-alanine N-acetyltransferase